MKKNFTLLASAILLLSLTSCETGGNVSVPAPGITMQDSATLFSGNTARLNVVINDAAAANQDITWTSSDPSVATVSNGVVTSVGDGMVDIVATTQDGNFTATTAVTVGAFGCNANTPNWGQSLGTVSFHTNNEWVIEGNGFTQIWSDAVTATSCQKTTYSYGTWASLDADCRSNPGFPGDFFSWCAVVRFSEQLCPYPWRVPTQQDFINLDIALGGSGENRQGFTSEIAMPEFVTENFINRWGGHLSGLSYSDGTLLSHDIAGLYWAQTDIATYGRTLIFVRYGFVLPQFWNFKSGGRSVRCVR